MITTDIQCTTDPISFKDLNGRTKGLPSIVEDLKQGHHLTIFFESKENMQAYLQIPLETEHEGYDVGHCMQWPQYPTYYWT